MPGYMERDEEGNERLVWENPMQREINEQATPFFFASIDMYGMFKACASLPYGNGFMNERRTVVDIIRLFESESAKFDSWYMKFHEVLHDKDDEDEE